jgi:hypothetical protein
VLAATSAGRAFAQGGGAETISETGSATGSKTPSAEAVPRIDEGTALMVGARRLKLGVVFFEYGVTEHVSVGTQPAAWALRAFKPVLVPNLNVKFQFVDRDPFWLAAMVAGYYGNISGQTSGQVLVAPVSLFASVRPTRRLYLHGEGTYVFARAFGDGDLDRAHIGGTLVARAVQAQLMVEVRVIRQLSLIALGRGQPYTSALRVSGSGPIDPYTTGSVDAELAPRIEHPWAIVGGVALLFEHFHLAVGAGYGTYFVPGMDVPLQQRGFVPAGSLAVLFTP